MWIVKNSRWYQFISLTAPALAILAGFELQRRHALEVAGLLEREQATIERYVIPAHSALGAFDGELQRLAKLLTDERDRYGDRREALAQILERFQEQANKRQVANGYSYEHAHFIAVAIERLTNLRRDPSLSAKHQAEIDDILNAFLTFESMHTLSSQR